MIPAIISPDTKSNAERRIFKWFQEAKGTDNWIVLHSLGLVEHEKLLYGEIDFLVIAPELGVFALEVKGGRVKRENGMWAFTNRNGETSYKQRGPFEQAKEGIHSLMFNVSKKVDSEHTHIGKLFYWYGVMFPDVDYESVGIEDEPWEVFDCNYNGDVVAFIKKLSKKAQEKTASIYGGFDKSKLPSVKDTKYLANLLRGDFDKAIAMSSQINYAEQELIELTQKQYACIDQLEDNKRGVVRGPAGTGKTLIAIEEAKRAVASGKKVALFCYNSSLGRWFKSYFETVPENLRPAYVGTFHGLMLEVAEKCGRKVVVPTDEYSKTVFYSTELPTVVEECLLDSSFEYDELILDEAQDLINDLYLDVMDLLLSKGLERGNWKFFGDFSNQAIYAENENEESLLDKLSDRTSYIKFKLVENCRNTRQICEDIQTITGFKAPSELWSRVDGLPVNHETCDTETEAVEKLEHIIDNLIKNGIEKGKITILSTKRKEKSIVNQVSGIKIKDFSFSSNKEVSFSTIHSFKGLENTIIIITDIDTYECEQLMYVGLSRARTGLFLIETKNAHKEYNDLLTRRLMNG